MKRIFLSGTGFTMVELLLAALFSLMVMASLYGFFREQLFTLLSQEVKIATLEEARGALDMMVRELRNAGSWATGTLPPGCQRIVAATATSIHIQADLDGQLVSGVPSCNSATGEDLTYELSSATFTCPGTIIRRKGSATDPGQCLVANVVVPSGSSFLTYYDASGNALPPPITGSNLNNIKRVKITFAVQVQNPNPYSRSANPNIASTLSSSVEFRN